MEMKKFTYRGEVIIGFLLEVTDTHYIVELEENDIISLYKESTIVEPLKR